MASRSTPLGAWKVVDAIVNGERDPDLISGGFWFAESTVVVGDEDAAWDYIYSFDTDRPVARLEIWNNDPDFPYRRLALWEVNNDKAQLCYSTVDQRSWPELIGSTSSSGTAVLTLQRTDEPPPE